MKHLYLAIVCIFGLSINTHAQQLSFNQLIGILQKLNNNDHQILKTIDHDLQINNSNWRVDPTNASLLMGNTPLESFVCAWSFKVQKQEYYRLGVSKSPIDSKLYTSLSYWFLR
jgi:excinuclease UvrABC nuclease subunit